MRSSPDWKLASSVSVIRLSRIHAFQVSTSCSRMLRQRRAASSADSSAGRADAAAGEGIEKSFIVDAFQFLALVERLPRRLEARAVSGQLRVEELQRELARGAEDLLEPRRRLRAEPRD